jgi:hypothetical protein
MSPTPARRWPQIPAALAFVSTLATAAAPAEPTDAHAAVPPVIYRSALANHQPLTDAPAITWPQANRTVGQVGGWRAYAREASQPDAAASATPSTPSTPSTPTPHHHGHKP